MKNEALECTCSRECEISSESTCTGTEGCKKWDRFLWAKGQRSDGESDHDAHQGCVQWECCYFLNCSPTYKLSHSGLIKLPVSGSLQLAPSQERWTSSSISRGAARLGEARQWGTFNICKWICVDRRQCGQSGNSGITTFWCSLGNSSMVVRKFQIGLMPQWLIVFLFHRILQPALTSIVLIFNQLFSLVVRLRKFTSSKQANRM